MAQISKALRESEHRFTARLIPENILHSLPQAELFDRITYAESLSRRAANATDPTLRRGYSAVAKAVLTARPRAEIAKEVAELRIMAAGMPHTARGDALLRRAELALQENPPAPRREEAAAVRKAKADKPAQMPVYDQAGNLVGLIDPAELIPVAGADAAAKPKQAQPAQPVAAPAAGTAEPAAVVKALGPSWCSVHDWTGRLVGAVRRADVTVSQTGKVAKSAAPSTSRANIYDARRRLLGQAPLARIVPLADLRAGRTARPR